MNPILYGHCADERIVAVHQKDDKTMRVYFRSQDGVTTEEAPFFPFFFLARPQLIEGFESHFWLKQLDGANHFSHLCAFQNWRTMWEAVRHILERHNKNAPRRIEHYKEFADIFLYSDPVTQYLMQTGRTLFKGMTLHDLHRVAFDIETYTSGHYRFSNAAREGDEVIIIAMCDNRGWKKILSGKEMSEKDLLQEFVRIIQEKNPDVLEGHNVFNFDLPYLIKRSEMLNVPLLLGRDSSAPRVFERASAEGDRAFEFRLIDIAGRHVIDTLILVQEYDAVKRDMDSHGLKYAAKYFGIAAEDRQYIQGEKIAWHWDNDVEPLLHYAGGDVDETRQLSDLLLGSSFFLTQMIPYNFDTAVRLGSAAKIESLLVREYLRQKRSIPKPTEGAQTTGGYTDIFVTGLLSPVLHADVESLYPSIMLHKNVIPASDSLHLFPTLLQELTQMRLNAKKGMIRSKNQQDRSRLDALQGAFKILINSFYGYLGYGFGLFNDYAQADVVTTTGQTFLREMMTNIESKGGTVIEVDTDGIFFTPPPEVNGESQEEEFVRYLSSLMPEGISIALSGRYRRMLSYKMKNYALDDYNGKITIKGSSLISRSMEPFGRRYVRECISFIMKEDIPQLHELYVNYREQFLNHAMDVGDFAKTERLRATLTEYQEEVDAGRRNRSAPYELAIASGRALKRGQRIRYYMVGTSADIKGFESAKPAEEWNPTFPDENVQYYLRRIDELSSKFEAFFSLTDHRAIFSADDLFPFDPTGIKVVTRTIEPVSSEQSVEENEE